jgi:hypothetical protein
MERWYRFSAAGSKPLLWFRHAGAGVQFREPLNRTSDRISRALTNAEAREPRLEDNAEALSLTLALAEKN